MPKTQAEIDLEIMQSKYGKNELLRQALDRAVLRGAMRVEAIADAMDLYGDKCIVDPTHLDVTLNSLPLDEAVEKLLETRALWRPQGPDPVVEARKQLEADALAGSVSAHGQLFKIMGKTAYDQWRAKNGAQPGKSAVAATDNTNTDVDTKNLFYGFRDASGKVVKAKADAVAAAIKRDGIAAVTKQARDFGVTLGGYPLVRKAG
jgi:hypothetical protein